MKKLSRKEAAKVLEDMKVKIEIPKAAVTQWERNTALDMAIEALKYSGVPNSSDCIIRQDAIDEIRKCRFVVDAIEKIRGLPSAQPERLTDDDFETIRILLNADKEKLCNQRRWKEAEEYQRIIDRFMAFASAQQLIPCSKRLPKVREWVLCQCQAGIMDVLRLTEDGYWNKLYPHAEYMGGFVVAWMPLPKLYTGKEGDGNG